MNPHHSVLRKYGIETASEPTRVPVCAWAAVTPFPICRSLRRSTAFQVQRPSWRLGETFRDLLFPSVRTPTILSAFVFDQIFGVVGDIDDGFIAAGNRIAHAPTSVPGREQGQDSKVRRSEKAGRSFPAAHDARPCRAAARPGRGCWPRRNSSGRKFESWPLRQSVVIRSCSSFAFR